MEHYLHEFDAHKAFLMGHVPPSTVQTPEEAIYFQIFVRMDSSEHEATRTMYAHAAYVAAFVERWTKAWTARFGPAQNAPREFLLVDMLLLVNDG